MFLRNKKKEPSVSEIAIQRIAERIDTLEEKINSLDMQQMEREVKKHNIAIENLLDDLEQQMEEEQEKKRMEEGFLSVFETYQEQFWQIKNYAAGRDEALAGQFDMIEQNLLKSRILCGITVIESDGEKVDYNLHEVVEAVDTTKEDQDKTIAKIYSPGYIYQGKVRKKAKAAVYRFCGK